MPNLSTAAVDRIDAIPNDGGWWKPDSRMAFIALAVRLVSLGVPESEAVAVLSRAYDATAAEFGN